MADNKSYSLYCLRCPSGRVRYIGITCAAPKLRLSGHIADTQRKRNDHKTNWIRDLIKSGSSPAIHVIREGLTRQRAEFVERFLIRLLQSPFCLVNSHEGGATGLAGMSPEARDKHRAAMKRIGGDNLCNVNHRAAQARGVASRMARKAERGPTFEAIAQRAKEDARGQVLRHGVTYSTAHPDGQPWTILRSKHGRINQVDIHLGNSLASTCGLRTLERAMARAKL